MRWWILLQVSGIMPSGGGWRLAAASTARKARASMARIVQRCQDGQRRTWVLVQAGQALAGLEKEGLFSRPLLIPVKKNPSLALRPDPGRY